MLEKIKSSALQVVRNQLERVESALDDTSITEDNKNAPQGKIATKTRIKRSERAVFFSDGTESEYEEMLERESKWYNKLKEWGLK